MTFARFLNIRKVLMCYVLFWRGWGFLIWFFIFVIGFLFVGCGRGYIGRR